MANIAQAIRMALHVGETRLGVSDIFGEDVGPPLGGVFTCTQGLKNAWNSPLDERGIVGTAMGLALAGQRPVCEIQFCDYIFNTIDLLKLVGNCSWSCMGQYNVPLVLMTPVGSGIHGSIYHSHSIHSIATHIPGWKIVLASTPLDAYGLLISAIQDPNPVMFLYPKALIRLPGEEKIPGEPEDARALSKRHPLGHRRRQRSDRLVQETVRGDELHPHRTSAFLSRGLRLETPRSLIIVRRAPQQGRAGLHRDVRATVGCGRRNDTSGTGRHPPGRG